MLACSCRCASVRSALRRLHAQLRLFQLALRRAPVPERHVQLHLRDRAEQAMAFGIVGRELVGVDAVEVVERQRRQHAAAGDADAERFLLHRRFGDADVRAVRRRPSPSDRSAAAAAPSPADRRRR